MMIHTFNVVGMNAVCTVDREACTFSQTTGKEWNNNMPDTTTACMRFAGLLRLFVILEPCRVYLVEAPAAVDVELEKEYSSTHLHRLSP